MKKKNAFTLIELIVVLVILAIIALIVMPLVVNIVKKSGVSADKRSVDGYGKSIETAMAEYLVSTGKNPKSIDDLDIKYTGNEVTCETRLLQKNRTVFLTGCSIDGRKVKDDSTSDGYYHYGEPIYTVYNIGDMVTYNNMDFYVITNSDEKQDYVTLLKADPLTVDEVNTYGSGYINKYTDSYQGTVYDSNGYGGMAYYSSLTCGYPNGSWVSEDCTTNYDTSDVKYAVDAWTAEKFDPNVLKEDSLGYKTRLITKEEMVNNLGFVIAYATGSYYKRGIDTPSWAYDNNYYYWTMSANGDSDVLWGIGYGNGYENSVGMSIATYSYDTVIRPVINIKKFALGWNGR